MKKVMVSFLIVGMIGTASIMLGEKIFSETKTVHTDEKLENVLAISMEESKSEQKKIEELLSKTAEDLNRKGYAEIGLSFSHESRVLKVVVKDQQFVETNKRKIEGIIFNRANEIKIQDFEVSFKLVDSYAKVFEENEKIMESTKEVSIVISDLLKEKGYNTNYSISTYPQKEITIILNGTQVDLKEKEELEKLIKDTTFSTSKVNYVVKVKERSESEKRDQEWQPILSAIIDEVPKEFEEYRGFAYSFHPEPLQIIIKTTVEKKKWFSNSEKKKAKQIAKYVDKIIELKREELNIEEIPYKVIIRDENNKEIKYGK